MIHFLVSKQSVATASTDSNGDSSSNVDTSSMGSVSEISVPAVTA
jgi:hypothetical protein